MKCLVTGCAGFIGSHLCERLLALGERVVGVDAFTEYYPRSIKEANIAAARSSAQFDFVEGDLLSLPVETLASDVDVVFHLAAQAGVRTSWGTEFRLYTERNVLAMQRLLEACRGRDRLMRFVYASSSSIYGNALAFPISEDAPPRPLSPYGVTKLAGEHLAHVYRANYGVPTVSLRYFSVYGARQRPDMAFHRFIAASARNETITIYDDGSQTRDFTHVQDVVRATVLAAERPEADGRIYNIAGGSYVSVQQALDCIAERMNVTLRVEYGAKEAGDVRDTHADITRARHDLGYEPQVSLELGLQDEINWYIQTQHGRPT